ncbi:hypothetical protein ABW19_dt0201674 [Dactylella cylindrospora]|nr:hypothetical protein ABW19_dt0201674 [Dactylella cylindrospora]
MAMHRRISLSDIVAPEIHENQPPPPLPPKYFEYKPGGRDEFFRDLDAYQAAAQIHATHAQAGSLASPAPEDAPSYDSIGESLPTIHETKVFKRRLLETLRSIRDFTEHRRRLPKWSNCFGLSDKVQIGLSIFLLCAIIAGLAALGVKYQQIAGLLAMSLFLVVHASVTFFVARKHILKTRLIEALQIGLAKVERFEKIDDKTLKRIKDGINATLNPMFWIESERRMEEAIPEQLRVPAASTSGIPLASLPAPQAPSASTSTAAAVHPAPPTTPPPPPPA